MTITTPEITDVDVPVRNGELTMTVRVLGTGPAVVYFHPAGGLTIDPYVLSLAESHTVYAPFFPGTAPGRPYDIHAIHELWDVVLTYQELLATLELDRPVAIAQSFGGMLAAEIAATFPDTFSKLVLLDPVGLWNDDYPVANWIATPPSELPALLFDDPTSPAAAAMFTFPDDVELTVEIAANLTWALGCTGKFVWPIPDKGLKNRLHRITSPTLLVWGENDKLSPAAYAADFARLIPDTTTQIIPDCGHIPQVEQQEALTDVVNRFLA